MSQNILIRPPQLRSVAQALRERTQRLRTAFEATDQTIGALGEAQFAGSRAAGLRARYQTQRARVLGAANIVLAFANSLEQAATVFEQADKASGSAGAGSGAPAGYANAANVNSTTEQRVNDVADLMRLTPKGNEILDWMNKNGAKITFGTAGSSTVAYASGSSIVINTDYANLSDYALAAVLVHEGTHFKQGHPTGIGIIDAGAGVVDNIGYAINKLPDEYEAFHAQADFWREVKAANQVPDDAVLDGVVSLIYNSDGSLRDQDAVFKDLHNIYNYDSLIDPD